MCVFPPCSPPDSVSPSVRDLSPPCGAGDLDPSSPPARALVGRPKWIAKTPPPRAPARPTFHPPPSSPAQDLDEHVSASGKHEFCCAHSEPRHTPAPLDPYLSPRPRLPGRTIQSVWDGEVGGRHLGNGRENSSPPGVPDAAPLHAPSGKHKTVMMGGWGSEGVRCRDLAPKAFNRPAPAIVHARLGWSPAVGLVAASPPTPRARSWRSDGHTKFTITKRAQTHRKEKKGTKLEVEPGAGRRGACKS